MRQSQKQTTNLTADDTATIALQNIIEEISFGYR